ncbi:hypothetical protein DAPPUDRAFT_246496 [Daphnia pulex]|uniref:Uncharacterized protein n=1 Tax=Daphnia pulex TaxID=6669 RepID=E9GQN5_DAPPU|nr:hypothetical protein DAPPUDRAFT_246496 [Daphnia pulex]|eukprot:EFX78144.1 hypothetical protein DAPPUDRAFT_246496 [Daphnia pulex]
MKKPASGLSRSPNVRCLPTAGDDSVLPAAILLSSTIESIEQLHAKKKFITKTVPIIERP